MENVNRYIFLKGMNGECGILGTYFYNGLGYGM
jgi:hypothetical protein